MSYDRGAWNADGRPTAALEAFREQPQPAPDPAQVRNPGFEYDGGATPTPTGWRTRGPDPAAAYTEGSAHAGSYRLTQYRATSFQVTTYQVLTNLLNGRYTLMGWVLNGGGQMSCQLYASGFGGAPQAVALPVAPTWTQLQIPAIEVTSGQCEIGLTSVGNAGNYCSLDDVALTPAAVTAASAAAGRVAPAAHPNPFAGQLTSATCWRSP